MRLKRVDLLMSLIVTLWSLSGLFGECYCAKSAHATNAEGVRVFLEASSLKTALKAYLAAEDLGVLKQKAAEMDRAVFARRYSKAYALIIKDSPELISGYGFVPGMSRDEFLNKVKYWDKKLVCSLIDSLPNEAVCRFFESYAGAKLQGASKSNMLDAADNMVRSFSRKLTPKNTVSGK